MPCLHSKQKAPLLLTSYDGKKQGAFSFELLEKIARYQAKAVVVTKYISPESTHALLNKIHTHPAFLGVGENRIEVAKEKQIPPEKLHFIGRLQSRKLKNLPILTKTIHSLDNLKHAEKLHRLLESISATMQVYLQVNISREPQKGGVDPENLFSFYEQVCAYRTLKVIGISAMGARGVSRREKEKEFQYLRSLREDLNPSWHISAGTSEDFSLALDAGIDILRIGRAFFPFLSSS